MENIRNPRKVSSMMGFGVFGMLVVWYVAVYAISYLLSTSFPSVIQSPWTAWLLNDVPLYFLGVPVMLLIFKFIPNGTEPERVRHKLSPLRYLLVIVFCLGSMYAISLPTNFIILFIESFKSSGGSPDGISQLAGASGILQNILFGACVPALGEEFVFRYMFRRKLKGASDKIYILVSALCFAMFHANFAQIGYAFVLGVVFAWLYTYTGNIWLPVSLHFIANLFGMILMPALVGYSETLYVVAFFGLVGGAVALFFVWNRRVFATWQPPTEAGWPYKPPKRVSTHYYIDPMTGRPMEMAPNAPQPPANYAPGAYPAPGYAAYAAPGAVPSYGAQAPYYTGLQPPYGAPPAAYPPPAYPTPAYPAPTAAYPYYAPQPYAGGYALAGPGPMASSAYGAPAAPPVAYAPPAAATPGTQAAPMTSATYTAAATAPVATAPTAGTGTVPAAAAPAELPPTVAPVAPAAPTQVSATPAAAPLAPATQAAQPGAAPYVAPVAVAQPAPWTPPAGGYGQPGAAAMPYGMPVGKLKSAFRVCIVNGGMLTYLIATLLLTLINLFG